ncbi:hypothetical protein E2C01_045191 [Portunus trituberculatus]|uniref:Peptidase M28 domain-containing protein n=1 Tax=Portunus trituberculatus TaxID=210409 RepID=A0A5B7G157_PORTR|nr:hypothetical protein [Portunus trituberculatus]
MVTDFLKLLVTSLPATPTPGTVKGDEDEVDLQQHLEKLSSQRYPIESNTQNRDTMREYIIERMTNYGLEVEQQKFNTTISEDPIGIDSQYIKVQGTNVIGIQRAVTEHPGAVVVVGADYDSNGVDDPLFHNGAGVATLLEAARLYTINERWSGRYVANYTTIFVAFDINTKLHKNSPGHPGGYYFVQNWLMPFLKQNADYFGGAIILDSIMNVNYNIYTQVLSNNFQENRRAERFRLEDMRLQSGMKFDNLLGEFVKSDNIHFWNAKDASNRTVQLPALLLTDTKAFRNMEKECVTDPCRAVDLVTEERLEFVEATVRSVTTFLFNRQTTRLPEQPSSGMSNLPSAIMTVLMFALVRLHM